MREGSNNAMRVPRKRLFAIGLVFASACHVGITSSGDATAPKIPDPPIPPQNKVKVESAYSPSATTIAITYRTKRNSTTGVVSIVKGETATKTIDINFAKEASSAAQPFEAILVSFQFSHKKESGKYAITPADTPVKYDSDNKRYRIDITAFAQKFATDINSTLPPSFDPNATDFDFKDAVDVIITPVKKSEPIIAAPINTGEPVTLDKKITITFNPAVGDS
jgi:hypothetical protein